MTNDGGPAFPKVGELIERGVGGQRYEVSSVGGMSLRDYFAGQALAGNCGFPIIADGPTARMLAEEAYQIADVMLKVREGSH